MTSRRPKVRPVQKALLGWYDRHKRDLPWRRTRDPYAIFVSEMMLQQTQVKTVIPYYERFMKELPDWRSLARADEQKVLKLWEGLGYYRRARNLRTAAQSVLADHQGKLPETLDGIMTLPGVGRYSAGAVLSIAFEKPMPLVDGNVIRVFARLFRLKGDLKTGPGHKKTWEIAEELLDRKRPGDFNQALMELGATICVPEDPQCLLCPLRDHCGACQEGSQTRYPQASVKADTVEVVVAAVLARQGSRFLVRKRPQGERWLQGLWEFPSMEGKDPDSALTALERKYGVKARRDLFHEVGHQITRHKIRLRLYQAGSARKRPKGEELRWVTASQALALPFSSAQNKLRRTVLKTAQKAKTPSGGNAKGILRIQGPS
ncbi:MAG TPA: A/G-specific adenine glycosylase [bacterium]|nr:A/G-specific adenine glycosylase [bacterium]